MKAFIGRLTWSVEEAWQTSETLRAGEGSLTTLQFLISHFDLCFLQQTDGLFKQLVIGEATIGR